MKSMFLLIGFLLTNNLTILKQTFIWDHYGLAVDVPDDFKVLKNSDTEFEMEGDGMSLFMYLFEEDIAMETMDEAVVEAATSIEMSEVDRAMPLTGNGLDGYYVEGFKEGQRVMLAGFIDPTSHTNFMMLIMFGDDDGVAEKDAIDIINSVRVK